MARENGGEPKVARHRIIGGLHRRRDVVTVATAVMVWIPLITIGGHLIGVARRMAQGNFVQIRPMGRNAHIRPLQHMCRRRRSKGEDEHQTSEDG